MSLNRRMDKENVVHLHNGVLLRCLKKWHQEIYRQMDETKKKVILSGVTQIQKDKHDTYSL